MLDPHAAAQLTTDLKTIQDLARRRGAAWLARWATMYSGIEPGQPVNIPTPTEAERVEMHARFRVTGEGPDIPSPEYAGLGALDPRD